MKLSVSILTLAILATPTVGTGSPGSNHSIAVSLLRVNKGGSDSFLKTSPDNHLKSTAQKEVSSSKMDQVKKQPITKIELTALKEEGPVKSPSSPEEPFLEGQSGEEKISLLPEDAGTLGEEDNLFGLKGGYFHPYLTINLEYTDNLFNLNEDKTSNFLTQALAGVWMSVPRRKIIPVAIATHNPSPGGLQMMLDDFEGTDRYQLYLKGGVDYSMYSADSELDDLEYGFEGMGRYNFPAGLSLQLLDQYTRSRDRYEIGYPDSSLLHQFYSNVLVGTVDWQLTDKFRAKADLSLFSLRYDDEEFDYLERDDYFVDLYGYFIWSEKTSFFLNYKFGVIGFDSYTDYDSQQSMIYGGMKWESTEKVSFTAKVGVQDKQYTDDASTFNDQSGLAIETQVEYRYSEKTRLRLGLYKRNEETDTLLAQDKNVLGATFNYDQDYTDKLHGTFRARYEYADYTELVSQTRDEWRIVLEPKLRYAFMDWINMELGYQFDKRDSTDVVFDYQSNSVFINLNLEL